MTHQSLICVPSPCPSWWGRRGATCSRGSPATRGDRSPAGPRPKRSQPLNSGGCSGSCRCSRRHQDNWGGKDSKDPVSWRRMGTMNNTRLLKLTRLNGKQLLLILWNTDVSYCKSKACFWVKVKNYQQINILKMKSERLFNDRTLYSSSHGWVSVSQSIAGLKWLIESKMTVTVLIRLRSEQNILWLIHNLQPC